MIELYLWEFLLLIFGIPTILLVVGIALGIAHEKTKQSKGNA